MNVSNFQFKNMLIKINYQFCLYIGNNNGLIIKLYNVVVEILREDNENI